MGSMGSMSGTWLRGATGFAREASGLLQPFREIRGLEGDRVWLQGYCLCLLPPVSPAPPIRVIWAMQIVLYIEPCAARHSSTIRERRGIGWGGKLAKWQGTM